MKLLYENDISLGIIEEIFDSLSLIDLLVKGFNYEDYIINNYLSRSKKSELMFIKSDKILSKLLKKRVIKYINSLIPSDSLDNKLLSPEREREYLNEAAINNITDVDNLKIKIGNDLAVDHWRIIDEFIDTNLVCFHRANNNGEYILMYVLKNLRKNNLAKKIAFKISSECPSIFGYSHNGMDHLVHAIKYKNLEVIRIIQNSGICNIHRIDEDGRNSYIEAIDNNSINVLKLLFDKYPSPDGRFNENMTFLEYAIKKKDYNLIRFLILYGSRTDKGFVMNLAVGTGNIDLCKFFAENNADINERTHAMTTPLITAIKYNHNEIAKWLINVGCNIRLIKMNGMNAFIYSSKRGRYEIFKILLETPGTEINKKDHMDFTALNWAAKKGHLSIVKDLIDYGCDLNLVNQFLITPLMSAVFYSNGKIIKLLINSGCSLLGEDISGQNVLSIALATCDKMIITFIKKNLDRKNIMLPEKNLINFCGYTGFYEPEIVINDQNLIDFTEMIDNPPYNYTEFYHEEFEFL
jgi:uncharacterized protein